MADVAFLRSGDMRNGFTARGHAIVTSAAGMWCHPAVIEHGQCPAGGGMTRVARIG